MMEIFLFCCLLILTAFSPIEKSDLPIEINYPNKLELVSSADMGKYIQYEYRSGEDILHIKHHKNCDLEKTKKMIADRVFFINSMYTDQPTPYPGILSKEIGCPPELIPTIKVDTALARMDCQILATSNLVFGNCNPNDNHYQCEYKIFYCEAAGTFEIKFFTPNKNPSFDSEMLTSSIRCK